MPNNHSFVDVIEGLYDKFSKTLYRFPLSIIFAIIAVIVNIYVINDKKWDNFTLVKITMISYFAVSFFAAIKLIVENWDLNRLSEIILDVLGLALLGIYYLFLEIYPAHFYNFALFVVCSHLLVSIAYLFSRSGELDFWLNNKQLLMEILISFFFTFVLYLGLTLAIAGTQILLKIDWDGHIYLNLFVLLIGIFNTLYFLSGVPKKNMFAGKVTDYPNALKIFVLYILLPIAFIYLVILYMYLIKIMIDWELPNGWVSSLVTAFSIVGILAYLLIYPLKDEIENRWIKIYSRYFFILLLPLLVLMSVAIGVRVEEYGITENRYFVIIGNLWLYGISFFYIFSKKQRIKAIPISLLFVCLLVSFGPWSALHISENSQISRLEKLLIENNVLKDGKLIKEVTVENEFKENISSIVFYLNDIHKFTGFKQWLTENTDYAEQFCLDSLTTHGFTEQLGLQVTHKRYVSHDYYFTYLEIPFIPQTEFKNYDYCFKYYNIYSSSIRIEEGLLLPDINKTIILIANGKDTSLTINFKEINNSELNIKLGEVIKNIFKKKEIDEKTITYKDLMLTAENEIISIKLLLNEFSISSTEKQINEINFDKLVADIYIKFKN